MLCSAVMLGAVPASAAVMDADRISGVPIASPQASPALRAAAPDVGMAAGILVTQDGRELWSRFADDERAMASTTKIMTAVVVLENADLDQRVTMTKGAAAIGESEAGLAPGRSYTLRRILEALLVKSGNDAAEALAQAVGGTEAGFVTMMNAKAKTLDLRHTRFVNAHGLDTPGHYTSAGDLATMARYAMGNPEFRRIVGLRKTTIPGAGGRIITLENSNKLLFEYPGATGVKTGWTDKAGYCVVGSAERGTVSLTAVVLGAQSETTRFSYAKRLFDWGFQHLKPTTIARAGDDQGSVPVVDYLDVAVPAVTAETTSTAVFDLDGPVTSSLQISDSVKAPVKAGGQLGTLTIVQGERLLAQVPVTAAVDVPAPSVWQRFTIGVSRAWRRVFGGQLVAPARAPSS